MLGLGIGLGFGVGAPSWTPKAIAGLALWLRGDMGVTLNGSKVSAWADQSGAGDANRNVVQATDGNRPTFVASDAAYNNKPTLTFVRANAQELVSGTWAAPLAEPETTFIVGNWAAGAQPQAFADGSTQNSRLFDNNGGGGGLRAYAGASLGGAGPNNANPAVLAVTFNGASSAIYVSAITAKASGNTGVGAAARSALRLGRDTAGSFYLNGKIAEVIIYAGALSTADRNTILDYLGTRYGIAIGA